MTGPRVRQELTCARCGGPLVAGVRGYHCVHWHGCADAGVRWDASGRRRYGRVSGPGERERWRPALGRCRHRVPGVDGISAARACDRSPFRCPCVGR